MSQKYINPYFENYYSVEELFETNNISLFSNSEPIKFESLEDKNSLLIIGEPGMGKSEFLGQYFDYLNLKNTPIAFLDLKTLPILIDIKEKNDCFFEDAIPKIPLKLKNKFDINKRKNDFDFKRNIIQTLILDGLDEIDIEYFEVIFNEIIHLKSKYKNLKILVSCRRNYVEKHQILFSNSSFKIISLLPFSYYQIGEYLDDIFNLDEFEIEFRNSNLISRYRNTFLNIPRYLSYFKELIIEKGFENIKQLGRHQIIEYVIYNRIKVQLQKLKIKRASGSFNIEIIVQILEKIALVLEIQESDTISKEEFSQFFLESSFNLHNEISLTQIQENTLIKNLDRHLQFDNTEFQEYLAAKQISRTSNYVQIFYDLTIDENLKEFKFNWFNVLSYLVEIKPNFILPIIKMGKRIDDKSLFKAIKFIKKDKIEDSIKSIIFHIIMDYYYAHKTWIDDEIENDLAEFGKNEIKYLIKKIKSNPILNNSNIAIVGNTCITISILIKNKMVLSSEFRELKQILLNYLDQETAKQEVVHRYSIKCLVEILNKNEIKQIIKYYSKLGNSVSSAIVYGIVEKHSNEHFSIELLINHIKSKSESNNIYLFNKINSSGGLIYILNYILKELKSNINYHESLIGQIGDSFDNESENVLNNIRNNWNEDFEKVILDILYITSDSEKKIKSRGNPFLFQLFNILLDKTRIPIQKILSNISKLSSYKNETYYLFSKLSIEKNYEDILNYVLLNDPENVNKFLSNLSLQNNEIYLQLKEKGIKCVFEHEENEIRSRKEEEINIIKKEKNDSQEKIKSFFLDLRNKQINILYSYDYYKDELKKTITKLQKSIIHNFIIENVFKNLSVQDDFEYFERSLSIFKNLNITNIEESLKPYRNKLLKCIVFYEDFAFLKRILGNISINEIEDLKVFFLSINSFNYWKTEPFLDFLDKNSENLKKNILEDLIKNINPNTIPIIEKVLTLYAKDFLDIKFLEEQFSNFKEIELKDEQDYKFLFFLNKVLVQNNSDFAINWLIENIKLNKYVFRKDPNSTNSIRGKLPQEDIGRNIGFIKSFKYSTQLLELIKYGMDLMASNFDYYKYVDNEILGFFQVYCSKLELNEKEYLIFREKLNIIIETNREKFSYNFLKDRFENILFSLKKKITKNKVNISGTIQKYETLQKKKYLDISYPKDVLDAIKEILEDEIKNEIKIGNFKHLFSSETDSKDEDFYEKHFFAQIELHLLRKGFRKNDIQKEIRPKIFRQIQGINNKRTDLLVSYGAIGSVLIELKKENNKIDKIYKETTLKNYMEFTGADFCICLIINDKEDEISFDKKIANYKSELEDEIYSVIGLTFLTPPKKNR